MAAKSGFTVCSAYGRLERVVQVEKIRRLQILTIGDLFGGAGIDMPPQHGTHQQAERYKPRDVSEEGKSQKDLV